MNSMVNFGEEITENTAPHCFSIVLGVLTDPLRKDCRLLISYCIEAAVLVVCFDVFTQ